MEQRQPNALSAGHAPAPRGSTCWSRTVEMVRDVKGAARLRIQASFVGAILMTLWALVCDWASGRAAPVRRPARIALIAYDPTVSAVDPSTRRAGLQRSARA